MRISHLLTVLEEAGLSPEAMAKRTGVSNMTIRRWTLKSPSTSISKVYARAIEDAVDEMITEGVLESDSRSALMARRRELPSYFRALVKNLGFGSGFLSGKSATNEDRLLEGISHIGSNESRRQYVQKNFSRIGSYQKFGAEWARRISILKKAVTSPDMERVGKFVAYGSFFYLFFAQDLIPDYIPVVGVLDDFAVLGVAANFLSGKRGKRS